MILMGMGLGLGTTASGLGALAFAWHPLLLMSSPSARWAGVVIASTVMLASRLRVQKKGRLFLSLAVGVTIAVTLGLGWIAALVLVFAMLQQLRHSKIREGNTRYWEPFMLIGGFALAFLISRWIPGSFGILAVFAGSGSQNLTPLGPLAWFDWAGHISRFANLVPADVSQGVNLGYVGVTSILITLFALWPSHARMNDARSGLPEAVIAIGLWAIWPLCGVSSFHSQMTRLFAVITVERQVSNETQHVIGFVAGLAYLMPILVLLALHSSIRGKSVFPWSLAVACGLAMIWWSVSPPQWNWMRSIVEHSTLSFARILVALAFGVGVCIGLERIAGHGRQRWPCLLLAALVLGLITIDFGMSPAHRP